MSQLRVDTPALQAMAVGWGTAAGELTETTAPQGVLRGLDSTDIVVQPLPVPPLQWTAAMRSCGTARLGDRTVWLQQSQYVAGSEQPHASQLTVHSIVVDSAYRERLAENITQLSDEVYRGFLSALSDKRHAH